VLGEPIAVASGLSGEEQERERLSLEKRLVALAARAREAAAGSGEIPAAN
jgi:hypothetical protein